MYKSAQQGAAAGQTTGGADQNASDTKSSGSDDDVVDADFEEVRE